MIHLLSQHLQLNTAVIFSPMCTNFYQKEVLKVIIHRLNKAPFGLRCFTKLKCCIFQKFKAIFVCNCYCLTGRQKELRSLCSTSDVRPIKPYTFKSLKSFKSLLHNDEHPVCSRTVYYWTHLKHFSII